MNVTGEPMGEEGKAEVKGSLLTPPLLLAATLVIVASQFVCALVVSLSSVIRGWFIGPIYILILVELLGRVSPKFRLKPGQLLILLLPFWFAAGKAFMITGAGGEGWGDLISVVESFRVRALADSAVRSWTWDLTPDLIAPKNILVLEKAWRGLSPGEAIDWVAWLPSTVFWAVWLVTTTLMLITAVYILVGPYTVEVERLIYPMSVPATIILTKAGTWVEEKGKSRSKLFTLGEPKMKAFWVSFALGAVFLSVIPMVMEVLPIVPILGASLWGEIPLPFHQFTAGLLPGSYTYTVFIIHQAILMTLLPYDIMVTALITWLIFWVIYPTVGVRAGFLPYQPGVEQQAHLWFGVMPPFPITEFGALSLTLGIGLLTLWEARGTLSRIAKGELKAGSELPVKHLAATFATLFLVWLVIWVSAGANPLTQTYLFILFMLWQIAVVRCYAEVWWHPPVMDMYYVIMWPVGNSLGLWGTPPSQSRSLFMQNIALVAHGSWPSYRQVPYNMGWIAHTYKWAHDMDVNLRDLLLVLFTVAIVGWPLASVISLWWMHHVGGYAKLNYIYNSWVVDTALDMGVRSFAQYSTLLQMPFWYHGALAALGVAVVFAINFLRARFAWFMINPTALAITMWLPQYMWSASLVALIAKYLGNKVFGARRYEEYASYVAAGLCWGLGSGYLIAGIYSLLLEVLPKFRALYVP